jgi:UDP-N-acetylmuramate dehydrogenase
MTDAAERLREAFGERARAHVSLAPLTTFKVGGAADWVVEAHGAEEVQRAVRIARESELACVPLGGGSNVLVSDAGVRGIVLRIRGTHVTRVDDRRIRAEAGLTINGLVRWTINHGVGGLESWAGTPGTVGGAVYGNAHFRGRLIGELVESVMLADANGRIVSVPAREMEFGYDYSRLHRTREVVISADFRVAPEDPAAIREGARQSLAFRKRTQPLESPSAGCVFQNPDPSTDPVPPDIPASAGALVDRAGLKGAREGGARVSTTHANFIVNEGTATATDIRRLIERCKTAVREKFGVELREEIVYLGF